LELKGQISRPSDQSVTGAWELVSAEDRTEAGETIYFWGRQPIGVLIYTATGQVAVQVLMDPRPSFASRNPWAPGGRELLPVASAEEISAAYSGYYAYFGTYTVDLQARAVTHHVTASLRPHEAGLQYVRPYEFQGDQLILRYVINAGTPNARTRTIIWRRLQDG
jgi:hypothetical protein